MTIGWFITWWCFLNVGVIIYGIQFGIKRTNNLTWEITKLVFCIPMILLSHLLVIVGLAPKDTK